MYTINPRVKLIQMYTDIITLHFKAKSLVYISSLKHRKHVFFINFKFQVFLKAKIKKRVLDQIFPIKKKNRTSFKIIRIFQIF